MGTDPLPFEGSGVFLAGISGFRGCGFDGPLSTEFSAYQDQKAVSLLSLTLLSLSLSLAASIFALILLFLSASIDFDDGSVCLVSSTMVGVVLACLTSLLEVPVEEASADGEFHDKADAKWIVIRAVKRS
jgi:hypothetical protein